MMKKALVLALCSSAILATLGSGGASAASKVDYGSDPVQYEVGSNAVEFYVSPDGNDAAAGTLAHPFKTIERARTAVRGVTTGMSGNVVVNLRGGTYRLGSPLELSDAAGDSGENGHRVIYQAYGYGTPQEEKVVLSGGRRIRDWTLVDPSADVWRADVGNFSSRQLYRAGQLLERGSIAKIPGEVTLTKTGYKTTSTVPQSWADPASIEFVLGARLYSSGICGVDSITAIPGGTEITMDQPCFKWYLAVYGAVEKERPNPQPLLAPSPLRNSRSFLTEPGTWAIDAGTPGQHHVYYRAQPGEDPNEARFVAPRLQTLVSGSGTPAAPIHDVSFRGVDFSYSTWMRPSNQRGYVQIYGDYYYDGGSPSGTLTEPTTKILMVPGAVAFEAAEDLSFEGSRFQRLGGEGLTVLGSEGTTVRGNVFARAAGAGLTLQGEEGLAGGNLVEQNWAHRIGLEYLGGIGMLLNETVGSTVQRNQVDRVAYSGIAVLSNEGVDHGLRILDNRVFDTNGAIGDGGGIYTNGVQGSSYADGALIEGNVVYGVINPYYEAIDPNREIGTPNGIYTDDGSDFVTLRRNVIFRNHQSWGGVAPGRMKFLDSYWDDDQLIFYGPTEGLEISGNTLLPSKQPRAGCEGISACRAILDGAGPTGSWREVLGLE